MSPAIENLELFAGTDLRCLGQFLQPDGTPVDCTGGALEGAIERRGAPLAELECVFTNAAQGLFEVRLGAAAVDAVAAGSHEWGLTYVDCTGARKAVMAGAAIKRPFPKP